MHQKCLFVWLIVFALHSCADANIYNRKVEKQILDNILSSANYDPRIRPSGTNITTDKPLEVTVNLHVRRINKVDDDEMTFSIETIFREEWTDERLQFQGTQDRFLTLNDEELIWRPDTFFNNYKGHHHDITRPNTLLRIYSNGSILLSRRYNLVLHCDMDLSKYPFDLQICSWKIDVYAWQAKDVALKWKYHPVSISKSLLSRLFNLESFYTTGETLETSTGNYTSLKLSFILKRQYHYYLIYVFIPCAMMVITAYSCLWIDVKYFTARIISALVTLFALTQTVTSINLQIPKVSYTKAIDVYTGISISFAFIVLIETVAVNFLQNKPSAVMDKLDVNGDTKRTGNSAESNMSKKWTMERLTNKLDAMFRVLLPILFCLFQIIYWGVCLLS